MSAKAKKVAYWVTTGVLVFVFGAGGVAELAQGSAVREGFKSLGYPAYLAVILGTWKLLGAAVLVWPRTPRIKEWAYAGIMIDLTSAAASHVFVADPPADVAVPLIIAVIGLASWALRPADRVLGRIAVRAAASEPASAGDARLAA